MSLCVCDDKNQKKVLGKNILELDLQAIVSCPPVGSGNWTPVL